MSGSFTIKWIDGGREPQVAPNPDYPDGVDLTGAPPGVPSCRTELPYPAPRCGVYDLRCNICGLTMMITTAGRADDPRSVTVPCLPMERA